MKLIDKPETPSRKFERVVQLLEKNPNKAVQIDVPSKEKPLRLCSRYHQAMRIRGFKVHTTVVSPTKIAIWLHDDED